MAGFLGNQPPKVPLTSADIADGTITNADIDSVSATKLTGSIADARVPASAVTQHVTGYDDSNIRADILKLALHQAVDGNRVAYNLVNSFIDGFEDDTGITTETNVDRNGAGEYINTATFGTPAYDTSDRSSTITLTSNLSASNGLYPTSGPIDNYFIDGSTGTAPGNRWGFQNSYNTANAYIRFQWASTQLITAWKWYAQGASSNGTWKWQGSDDGSTWTDVGSSFTLSVINGTTENTSALGSNGTGYKYYQLLGVSGTLQATGNNVEIQFKQAAQTFNATGTLISDAQSASSSRTSCSGVIIYSDASGTATLGTDLKIYFTCNNGTNWTEATSYRTATTYSGTKKLVTLGATTCTAGTQVAMKAVWANQASGSKETLLEGWAVNY